jgi:hypothetical protein
LTSSSRPGQSGRLLLPGDHPLIGHQRPRICTVPLASSTAGPEVIELARRAGLRLDDWQQFLINEGLGEDDNGLWAALEVAIILSRQNGKGSVIEARQLAGLFLFDEELQIYTAHEFKTARNQMRRILQLIESTPSLKRQLKAVRYSHSEEGIELKNGQRLLFMARTEGSGRGFSADCVYLDEAMILNAEVMSALLPTLSARPNPQIWYFGSAGIGLRSEQLGLVRARGVAGGDPGLAFFEWSAELCTDECPKNCRKHDNPNDVRTVAKANPALGIRISPDFVEKERRAMKPEKFRIERLGVGEYPVSTEGWELVDEATWRKYIDVESEVLDPVALCADISPERTSGALAIGGRRADGLLHGEVVDYRATGTGWMVGRMVQICREQKVCAVVIDAGSPAGTLIARLRRKLDDADLKHIEIVTPGVRDVAQAYGSLITSLTDTGDLRFLDQAALNSAMAGAQTRDVGALKLLSRKNPTVDISPLVAFTNAIWGFEHYGHIQPVERVIEGDLMA